MARKKNEKIDMDEFNRKIQEQLEESAKRFKEEHTLKVKIENGYTYVTYKANDYINRESEAIVCSLLRLMDVEIIVYNGVGEYGLAIEGDNPDKAKFIQKFIDDGYKLKWE